MQYSGTGVEKTRQIQVLVPQGSVKSRSAFAES